MLPARNRLSRLARLFPLVVGLAVLPANAQKLSEVVAEHAGTDAYEYVEIFGNPSTSYSGTRILFLEGDAAENPGRIDAVFTPGTTNGAGFWTTGFLTSTLESPTFTVLLVSGLTGAVGDDLDTNDDGTLDSTPWTTLLDGVALTDGAAGARTYTSTVLGPGLGGSTETPGGASRWPYFRDTDTSTDWRRNDFDGEGLWGPTGTLTSGEARNTPGWPTTIPVEDYYASVDPTDATTLRTTLHALIQDHVRYPYTAGTTDTWDILNQADEDPANSANVVDIYLNQTYVKISGGQGAYNREHSWPNSYGFSSTGAIPYTDCHHLFVSEVNYNQDRGNKPYGNCTGCTRYPTVAYGGFGGVSGAYPSDSNWKRDPDGNTGLWETWNHRQGDVARAQLYLDVRYEGGTHAVYAQSEPDLVLTDNTSLIVITSASPAYMGKLTDLLGWHAADRPDDGERRRNEVVEGYQGNRNPFVDHPEWAPCLFQGTCCAPAAAPTASNDGPVCAGQTLTLSTPTVGGATYAWTGPNGFSSSLQNPSISPATAAATGTYYVWVTVGGCSSAAGTTSAVVNADTTAPAVTAPSPVTVDQPLCCGAFGGATGAASAALSAFLSGGSATDGCDLAPVRLAPQAGGVDATDATCFGAGTTSVTFRYRDAAGNLGTANASVTVRMYGDLNLDETVDPADMVVLQSFFNFAASPSVPPFGAPLEMADLTHDATVDPADMVQLQGYFNFAVTCLAP
ncbi:hypothetical protein FBQ97_09270 [Acidobacteria bacterium ACD]|nr:hypothetical protein [Acidobacteria bacterium ACD]